MGFLRGDQPLTKRRFLGDINPARIGVCGAVDYDHDVAAQRLLARFVRAGRAGDGVFSVEPQCVLAADTTTTPHIFGFGDGIVVYRPDANFAAADVDGRMRRVVVEYERRQTRRAPWGHIERVCAMGVGAPGGGFVSVVSQR